MQLKELAAGTNFKKYNNGELVGHFQKMDPIPIPNLNERYGLAYTAWSLGGKTPRGGLVCIVDNSEVLFEEKDGDCLYWIVVEPKMTKELFEKIRKQ